ncbi:MAG: phosphotriesterase, partial [Eubacteriales bacterium]|nr:phosphotriesterase [Eubacteriales bacterium]
AARAAAAHKGVPLILHTDRGAGAPEALTLCAACGLPERRVVVCHADRQAGDRAPHEAIARAGAMLGYDTIGRFKYHGDAAELTLIRHMIGLGYAGRLLLSLDTTRERLSSYGGSIGLTYLLETFLPLLRAGGIRAEDIDLMTTGNARRLFEA